MSPIELCEALCNGTSLIKDKAALRAVGIQTRMELEAGRAAIETVAEIRETLIAFGALEQNDRITGLADLLDVLLPPQAQG